MIPSKLGIFITIETGQIILQKAQENRGGVPAATSLTHREEKRGKTLIYEQIYADK
jgi:hypothetical protein